MTLLLLVLSIQVCHVPLAFACANIGGLGYGKSGKLDEALQSAASTGLTALSLQETRWSHSSAWSSGCYDIIHSGHSQSRQSYSGVLVAVKDALDIRYDEVLPGRMLRVQFQLSGTELPIEIVSVYAPPIHD